MSGWGIGRVSGSNPSYGRHQHNRFFYINWGFLCVSNWRSWESINGVWLGVSIGNLLILDTTRLNTCERTLMGILVAWLQTINGLFGWIRVLGVRAQ